MKCKWYVTFHGGDGRSDLNSVHAYSADGKNMGKVLDRSSLPGNVELRELRGFAFGPDGDLYVVNAYRDFSQVIRFHGIRDKNGRHAFRDVFVQNDAICNPGLSHPFSIVFDEHGDLYVTSQNTSLTLRYHGPKSAVGRPGMPMPIAPSLAELKNHHFSPGTFCASANEVPNGLKVVREALFAAGHLYVADRDADCVRKYEPGTGAYLGAISAPDLIDKPIHLAVSGGVLYIGNRGNESVVKCDLRNERVAPFIHPKSGGLDNPSGLAIADDGYLYVASRGSRKILRYQLSDGVPDMHPFIDDLADDPEFIEPVC
jgi:DNA-binding beta-propeller fold protein YncE